MLCSFTHLSSHSSPVSRVMCSGAFLHHPAQQSLGQGLSACTPHRAQAPKNCTKTESEAVAFLLHELKHGSTLCSWHLTFLGYSSHNKPYYTAAHKLFDWDLPHTEQSNAILTSAIFVNPSVASSMCKTGLW